MSNYAIFFSYAPQTWAAMVANPSDRAAAIQAAVEPIGITIDAVWFMTGGHDGMVLFSGADAESASAAAIAVTSSGAFTSVETRTLFSSAELVGVLQKAGQARSAYRTPGT